MGSEMAAAAGCNCSQAAAVIMQKEASLAHRVLCASPKGNQNLQRLNNAAAAAKDAYTAASPVISISQLGNIQLMPEHVLFQSCYKMPPI
jgi:hypothetical protein